MLYGNIIFIKKKGGDGSKYPVSEKRVKIGRSEACLIRIYNTQVALEHCQLIIGENGQATLKDLSNQTFLNGNILSNKEATLCHGDVFKVGERLARWEYLPTSKYYRQPLSPTGRLVAVVLPQQRCSEGQSSGASVSDSVLKNIPVEGKRRYSERFASENASAVKIRKSGNSNLGRKSKGDLLKLLTGRHSLKTKKLLLPVAKIKERKSTAGILNSPKTPKRKSEKSPLSSRKLNIVLSPSPNLSEESFSMKSDKSFNSTDISLLKNTLEQEPQKLISKKRTSQKNVVSEGIAESASKNVKTPVNIQLKFKGSKKLRRSSSESPSPKRPSIKSTPSSKPVRLIQSEKKLNSSAGRSSVHKKDFKRLSVVLTKENKSIKNSELLESFPHEGLNKLGKARKIVSDEVAPQVYNFQNKSVITESTPSKKTPKKSENSIGRVNSSSTRKSLSKSPFRGRTSVVSSASAKSPKSSPVKVYLRKTVNLSNERISSPRGIRRKLSPSMSSAEKAAKKLKTSSPKKPDKNKKAALLVLGKANRKQLLAQNVKVLLKQKIVKRAIKQSSTIENGKMDSIAAVKNKPPKKSQKSISKPKIKAKKKNNFRQGNTPAISSKSMEVPSQSNEQVTYTSKGEIPSEGHILNNLNVTETSRSPSKSKNVLNDAPGKSLLNEYRKSESPRSILSQSFSEETHLSFLNFEKAAENFIFNSNRRCSKRLSSKNDLGRPDFDELSPTALGLIPKNIEIFKTPKQNKRKSASLVTPRSVQSVGIIKSASTSKIGSRKNVRFSSKDMSPNYSQFCSPNEKTDFDLGAYQTPDVSVDVFISPLGDKTDGSRRGLNESSRITLTSEDNSELALGYRSNSEPRKCIRKLLQSPQPKNNTSVKKNEFLRNSRSSTTKARSRSMNAGINSEGSSGDFDLEVYTITENNLSDTNGVAKFLRSPMSDSTDVRSKKLRTTPKVQKSPKNDLSDLRGVKKLLRTPKVQKSPKNDLSDLRGVKKLLRTPKVQKSPKNDLSDLRGVKKLLRTPKVQKSPKNDLSDLKGVKKLLATPKVQKSPKNDLSDLRGVKKLLATPKMQKSPKNNLTNVVGVKELFRNSRTQNSPKNELLELSGVEQLLGSPKLLKNVSNNSAKITKDGRLDGDASGDLWKVDGEKQMVVGKSRGSVAKNQKTVTGKSRARDLGANKRGRANYSRTKEPKNDLSDLTGVRELFSRYEPDSNFNETVTGVAQAFSLPEEKTVSTSKAKTLRTKTKTSIVQNLEGSEQKTEAKDEYIKTRGAKRGVLRKVLEEETTRKSARSKKLKTEDSVAEERKPRSRKPVQRTEPSKALKSTTVKKSERIKKETGKNRKTSQVRTKAEPKSGEIKTRKRKAVEEIASGLPPKLSRKRTEEGSKKKTTRSKTALASTGKKSTKTAPKASGKVKTETPKSFSKGSNKASKTSAEKTVEVQKKRRQSGSRKNISDSEEKVKPRKTRSAKSESVISRKNSVIKRGVTAGSKVSASRTGRKKLTPVVKKSTKRK